MVYFSQSKYEQALKAFLCPVCKDEGFWEPVDWTSIPDIFTLTTMNDSFSVTVPMTCKNGHSWNTRFDFGYSGWVSDSDTLPYREYLKSDQWKLTRTAAIKRAEGRCQFCNSTERLEVHHRTYERLGAEEPGDLLVLCRECHSTLHGVENGRPTRMPVK